MTRETQSDPYATILLHSAEGESFNDAENKTSPTMNVLDHSEKRNTSALHTLCSGDVGVSLLVLFTIAAHQEGFLCLHEHKHCLYSKKGQANFANNVLTDTQASAIPFPLSSYTTMHNGR